MPEHLQSDEQILTWLRQPASREAGFRALLVKYQEKLYWHLRRMVGTHEDADDVLQNSLIKVFRFIDQFEERASLYSWLFRIASNEALTFLQQRKKRTGQSGGQPEDISVTSLPADPYFDGNELQEKLQKALQTLPDKQRQVFLLRYYEEMSYKDIAATLDTSEGALKASFHHAVKKVERYLLDNALDSF